MQAFTYPKFQTLTFEKRHKICAKLLNGIYRLLLSKQACFDKITEYQLYASWLMLEELSFGDLKKVADRYHLHRKEGKQTDNESACLPFCSHFDNPAPKASLPIHVYLDQIRSAHNVGSILRTVESFGLDSVYFSSDTPWVSSAKVQKTACGTENFVKCFRVTAIETLPRPLIALETVEASLSLFEYTFPSTCTLALGNEEYGCSDKTLKEADQIVKIPLRGRKNSLNVANAFAIAAAEISRQRT